MHLGADRVAGLVLVSGTIESNTERNRSNFGELSLAVTAMRNAGGEKANLDATQKFLTESYRAGEWDPRLYDRVLAANLSLSSSERSRAVQRPSHRYASELNALGVPVLLIHGDADNLFSVESSRAAHADLVHSELLEYADTGHWPFLERSRRFDTDVAAFADSVW